MVDMNMYIEGLKAVKDDVLSILEKSRTVEAMVGEIGKETEVEFPYMYEISEISRAANSFVQQVDVDIQAFEKKSAEDTMTSDSVATTPDVTTLKQLVAKM